MESYYILDSQISASSEWSSRQHASFNARLNFQAGNGRGGAWAARSFNHAWLQVDFVKNVTLGKVATQGRQDFPQWVKSYALSYGMNGVDYETYEQDGSVKVRVKTCVSFICGFIYEFVRLWDCIWKEHREKRPVAKDLNHAAAILNPR